MTIDEFKELYYESDYYKRMYDRHGDILLNAQTFINPSNNQEERVNELFMTSASLPDVVQNVLLPIKFITHATKSKRITRSEYYKYHYTMWLYNTTSLTDSILYILNVNYGFGFDRWDLKMSNIIKKIQHNVEFVKVLKHYQTLISELKIVRDINTHRVINAEKYIDADLGLHRFTRFINEMEKGDKKVVLKDLTEHLSKIIAFADVLDLESYNFKRELNDLYESELRTFKNLINYYTDEILKAVIDIINCIEIIEYKNESI